MSELNHSSFVTSPQTAAAASLLALNQGQYLNCRESPGTSAVNNSLFAGYPFNTKEEIVDSKTDSPQVDLYAMADENGVPGQGVVSINPFPEGAEQTSPITPVTNSAPSQILPYRPSASSGDAMLSAINYNENEILQDGAFDVSVAATLPNLDDGLLSNMGTHDLFDGEGNVNDSYEMEGLSPHSFNDPGSGLVDGSLSSVIDSDSLGSLDQARTPDSSKQKKKMKSQKLSPGGGGSQGSPGRPGIATCPTCNKSFNNSSALAKHRLTHSDERKYVCNLCQKAFKRQDHLNGHLMTHRDKKPYECTVENCQKSYCDARSLRRHLENHHNQTPEQIQSAIAKVASNAAAVIAAAAASNTASIKASNPSSASSPSSTHGQQQSVTQGAGSISTAQPLSSEGQQVALLLGQDSNTNTQFSENSTPLSSPSYPVQSQQQQLFQYDQQLQPASVMPQSALVQQPVVQQVISNQQSQADVRELQQPQQTIASNFGLEEQRPQTITIQGLAQQPAHVQQAWQETLKKLGQPVVTHQSNPHSPRGEEPSPGYSPISPVPTPNLGVIPSVSPAHVRLHATSTNTTEKSGEDKSVICTICDRSFKNVQALNGHMRLHGGYFKKVNSHDVKEEKKSKKMPTIREMVPPQPVGHQPAITTHNQQLHSSTDQVESSQQSRLNEGLYGSQVLSMMSSMPPESPQGEAVHQVTHPLSTFPPHMVGTQHWDKIQLHHAQQQEQQQLQHQTKQLQLHLQKQQRQEQQAQLQQQQKQQQAQLQQQQEQKIQQEQQIQSQIQQQLHQLQLEQLALEQHLQAQRQQQQEQQQHVLVKQEQAQIQYLQQQASSQANSMPPSPQVPQSPHLQRQSSIESTVYDYQHSNSQSQQQTQQYHPSMQQDTSQDHNHPQYTSPIPSSMAVQLQQLAQRQEQQRQEQELAQRQEIQRQEQELAQRQEIQRQEHELAQRQEIQRQEQELAQRQEIQRQEQELAQRQEIQRQEQELAQRQLLLRQEQELVQRQEQLILTSRQEHQLLQTHERMHQQEQGQQITERHIVGTNNPGHSVLQHSVQPLPASTSVTINSYQHLSSPPSTNLSSVSVHSNLPSAFAQAQISNFALQNPTLKNEMQTIPVSAIAVQRLIDPSVITASPVTIVSTTSSQEMTVSQLLNTLENPANFASLQNFLPVNAKPSATESANVVNKPEVNVGNQQMESSVVYTGDKSNEPSSVFHSIGAKSQDFDLDSRLDDINDIYKKELSSAATKENPFTFPPIDVDMTEQVNNSEEALQNGNSLVSKTIQGRHKELKRRLSLGNEIHTAPVLNVSVSPPKTCATTLTKHTLSNSAFSDNRQRIRSKSGDDFKYCRSKSEEYSFMRPRSRTEVSPMKSKSVEKFAWERSTSYLLSRSDGAQHSLGQFRNPNMLPGQPKIRRKHRPAPLFIPPHRGFSGFQSNLRSPRVPPNVEGRGHTPPPYTPPPMLSPNRSGSGLFCSISGVWKPAMTPKSAPITPRSSLLLSSRSNSIIDDSAIEPVQAEGSGEAPPETDVLPHVNIGTQYQAEIPPYDGSLSEALQAESREDLLWDPANVATVSDEDVQYYQDLACSAAVNGNGFNVEYALHILNIYKGNIQTAMLRLMGGKVSLPKDHTLLSYTYQETDSWTTEEIERYQQALWKCDKDFYALSKEMGTKSVKECVQFYYLWKKVCPDEHKRLRLIRRRREQERLYNLRSNQQQQQTTQATSQQPPVQAAPPSEAVTNYEEFDEMESESGASTEVEEQNDNEMEDKMSDDKMSTASSVSASPTPTYTCNYPDCNATFNSKQGLNGHVRIHKGASGNKGTVPAKTLPSGEITGPGRPATKPTSHANRSPMYDDFGNEIFPCRLCGRVFTKVKSRSAHMKSHRIIDNDKNKNKTASTGAQNNFEISVNKFQGSPHR